LGLSIFTDLLRIAKKKVLDWGNQSGGVDKRTDCGSEGAILDCEHLVHNGQQPAAGKGQKLFSMKPGSNGGKSRLRGQGQQKGEA